MARTKNPELRKSLERILQESLMIQGLDATSYQHVAEKAGISRALVQHYYPRKVDFAAEYLNRLLATIAKRLGIVEYSDHSLLSYEDAHRMGCLYYGFLLRKDGARSLLYDLLKDRELADELMRQHYEWSLEWLDPGQPDFEHRSQLVIEVWGGFYELMYYSIKHDFDIDVSSKMFHMLDAFFDEGAESSEVRARCEGMSLDANLIAELKERMARATVDSRSDSEPLTARA